MNDDKREKKNKRTRVNEEVLKNVIAVYEISQEKNMIIAFISVKCILVRRIKTK